MVTAEPAAAKEAGRASYFTFSGGGFREVAEPAWLAGSDDWEKSIREAGFVESQRVGDGNGMGYTLFESDREWVVLFSTCFYNCVICCGAWPDLIGLLSRLSGIALAGAVEQTRCGDAFLRVEVLNKD